MNKGVVWPVQFIVTTHSTHIANEADFNSIRYFLTNRNQQIETKIKDLRHEFKGDDVKSDREFLHKYLTLTKCDLFFSDKAILIEGITERILMPIIIDKVDNGLLDEEKLKGQYLTVVEIGGAYAHHFYKFLDFLELRTLIITDLDSVVKKIGEKITYSACQVSSGTHSSNAGIKNWLAKDDDGYIPLATCQKADLKTKIQGCRRIAFQIPEANKKYTGRSFEDAFKLANLKLFDIEGANDLEIETSAFTSTEKVDKADFALEYALKQTGWIPPLYIKEGLEWLAAHPNTVVPKAKELMAEIEAVDIASIVRTKEDREVTTNPNSQD